MNNQQEKTLLPNEKKRELKKMAHHLKPVVIVGKGGISAAVIAEIETALNAHELIKLRMAPKQKEEIETNIQEILRETGAEHIDTIGNIVILFRKNPEGSRYDI